jgi:hypothetical protein
MANSILRPKATYTRVGIGRTEFNEKFRLNSADDPYVPGTDGSVRRVRAMPLGERSIGYFDDEIDRLIEELRRWRDRKAALPPPVPLRSPARSAAPSARPLLRRRPAARSAQRSR